MPLNERQRRALEVLDWLHDPYARREGRSLAIAVAAIRMACRYPRTRVYLFDHTNTSAGRQHVFLLVRDLVDYDYRLRSFADFSLDSLTLNLPLSILDWMPPEGFLEGEARTRGRAAVERFIRMRNEEVMPEDFEDFEAFRGGRATSFPEAQIISQEMADRIRAETDLQEPAPKPQLKSVWDRLLADDD